LVKKNRLSIQIKVKSQVEKVQQVIKVT
jgi:hypothetical protein